MVDAIGALSTAKDLENALIEKNYLEVYATDNPQIVNVMNKLREATNEHRKRISEAFDEAKKRGGGSDVAVG